MRRVLIFIGFIFAASAASQIPSDVAWNVIQKRDLRQLTAFLDRTNVNQPFTKGATLLGYAASSPWPEAVDLLLKRGANPNQKVELGQTPLMLAAERANLEIVKSLLNARAEAAATDDAGSSALHYCVSWSHGCVGVAGFEESQASIITLLVSRGADINARGKYGRTALMWAAGWRHFPQMEALLKAGADLDVRDSGGRTALTWCANDGRNSTNVQTLLRAGAREGVMEALLFREPELAEELYSATTPTDLKGPLQEDLLMRAASIGSIQLVEKLIARGADVKTQDSRGRTCLFYATGVTAEDHMTGLRRYLLSPGNAPRHAIVTALIRAGADPKIAITDKANQYWRDAGQTPLSWAIAGGSVDAVIALLAGGAEANVRVKDGYPLDLALEARNTSIIEALISAGADARQGTPLRTLFSRSSQIEAGADENGWDVKLAQYLLKLGADPNAREEYGCVALTDAVRRGNLDAVKLLLDAGAKIDGSDRWGMTALMCAARDGQLAVVELLLARGADKSLKDKQGHMALDHAREGKHTVVAQRLQG